MVTTRKARKISPSAHGKNPKLQEPNSKHHSPSSCAQKVPDRRLNMDGHLRNDSLAGHSVAKSDLLRLHNVQTSRQSRRQKTAQQRRRPTLRFRNTDTAQSRPTVAPDCFTYSVSSAPAVTTISAPARSVFRAAFDGLSNGSDMCDNMAVKDTDRVGQSLRVLGGRGEARNIISQPSHAAKERKNHG
jgi:hypothetical protein